MDNITSMTGVANMEAELNQDWAKILAILTLGGGSFLCGMLPMAISQRNRRRFPLSVSLLLCFGAGVLLATAFVHMLPEVRRQMPKNAEIVFCTGFFIIYFIDETIHYFFGEAHQHSHDNPVIRVANETANHSQANYGTNGETRTLLSQNNEQSPEHCQAENANARLCHVSHTEPCSEVMTGTLGLLCALSLHSFIEGLAIGVQKTTSEIFVLLGAVACHKYVMGFCLGLEFCSTARSTIRSQLISISIFSVGSMAGIATGMAIVDLPDTWTQNALPILQALAGGTLLYVTVSEVLPREKARWHQNAIQKFAGISQFFVVTLGFAFMTVINFYLDDD